MIKKRILLLLLISSMGLSHLHSQTKSDYEKYLEQRKKEKTEFFQQRNKQLNQFRKKSEDYIAQQRAAYAAYVEKRNKEFAAFLEKRWTEYQVNEPKKEFKRPKPKVVPKLESDVVPEKRELNAIPMLDSRVPKLSTLVPKEGLVPPSFVPDLSAMELRSISFFGTKVKVPFESTLAFELQSTPSEKSIAAYWSEMASLNYSDLLFALLEKREELQLNDWGYLLFLEEVSKLYSHDLSTQRLFQWFMLVQSSYDVRIGYSNNLLTLLVPSAQKVAQMSYMTIGKTNYYSLDELSTIACYDGNLEGCTLQFDFTVKKNPLLTKNIDHRFLEFQFNDQSYKFNFSYNENLVTFQDNYPCVDFFVHFNSVMSDELLLSVKNELEPVIKGMNKQEALEFLLSFVQEAFPYATDDEQFGYENYLFFDESIHFPSIDCEDRSFLFANLVRNLLDLQVVGLFYPNHVSTAVALPENIEGDYITYNGQRYYSCDPTYVGAGIGRTMPVYRDVPAEIITVN